MICRQLNIFSGQLYIQSLEEYKALCCFLGLSLQRQNGTIKVAPDGFISPASRALSKSAALRDCRFSTSQVAFVAKIMAMRRKGQGITVSHMGRILNGELLLEKDF